ncbi:PAS domain S-box-containing protein [Natronoarchaeum philippinense]|uniref:PAS domain S-box-containing protein n=1 Tax=Natronoarchaeum philippinense TaxID=558529 RepID=A0A285NEN7_NATPI|nr:response regulator [Natronoarchaeum philippinense]SNZ06376.1 PAS domain S-box-containing protein [Natronoarchaeum philippinense]
MVHILHVDDDPQLGKLVKRFLERDDSGIDCRVRIETSPAAALDRIRSDETELDCVISDYRMPEMNGIELLRAVRETHPELPLLLFSGEEPNDVAAEIIRAGVTDYLQKGVGTEQYTHLIRRVEHAIDSEGEFEADEAVELDGVGIVGHDEQFEEVDESYAEYYRYDADEIEGKHWSELHPDDEVEHIRTHVLPVVQEGGKWSGHSTGVRADGSTFTESKMVTTLDDGRLLIAVSELDGQL